MYRIEDKSAAIAEIQRLLSITQTSIYDKNTINSVAEHQQANNIPVTGIVDYETFTSIVNFYNSRLLGKIESSTLIEKAFFPLNKGAYGSEIEYINILLKNILEEYRINLKSPYGKYYGYDTINAVNAAGAIFNISVIDGVSPELYNRMLIENKAIAIKKAFK